MDYKRYLAIGLTGLIAVIQSSYSYELLDIDYFAQNKVSDWDLTDPMYLKLRNDAIPLFMYQENDPPEEDDGKKKKKKPHHTRTVFTDEQLNQLKHAYALNPKPDDSQKSRLCQALGIKYKVLKVWFQNRRCKDKKNGIIHPGSSTQTQSAGLATVTCDSTSAQHMAHPVQLPDTTPLQHFDPASASASASASAYPETNTIESYLNILIATIILQNEEADFIQQNFTEALSSDGNVVIETYFGSFLYIPTLTPGTGYLAPISNDCQIHHLSVSNFSVVPASNPATPQQGSLTLLNQQTVPFTVNQGLTDQISTIYTEITCSDICEILEDPDAAPQP